METLTSMNDCIRFVYQSYSRVKPWVSGYNSQTRDLTAIQKVFALAGIPLNKTPAIAVTGSKGKGSTAILCSAMLQAMGYKVGLVTSPHLVDFCERIRLNGKAIPESAFMQIINDLAPAILQVDQSLEGLKFLGPTGIILACALKYFYANGAEAIVLEAGRGGRFDDNSLLDHSVTCLTPIMAEHLDKLGPTILDVAWHKAGMARPNSTILSAPQLAEVDEVIQAEAERIHARVFRVGREILYEQCRTGQLEQQMEIQFPAFNDACWLKSYTAAEYQGINLAVAFGAVSVFTNAAIRPERDWASRMSQVRFPGRCDVIHNQPLIVVDGAINGASAHMFLESTAHLIRRPMVLVTSLPHDKDYRGFLEAFSPLVDHMIVTRANNPNLIFTDEPLSYAASLHSEVIDRPDSQAAFREALDLAGADGMVCVVGTQSLVRDAMVFWKISTDSIWQDSPYPAFADLEASSA